MENNFAENLSTDASTNGTAPNINMDSSTVITDSIYERPRDPRDIKRSRGYQFDNRQPPKDKSTTTLLDSSVLTPITNNDMLNGINVAGQRIDLPATVSDEATVNLTDSSETTDVTVQETEMDVDIKPIFKIEDDGMEVELPVKEYSETENKMDTDSSTNPTKRIFTNTLSLKTKGIRNSPMKSSKLFSVSPDLDDDDISLPSSKELSNQILLSNLRDIDSFSDSMHIQPLQSSGSTKKVTHKKESSNADPDSKLNLSVEKKNLSKTAERSPRKCRSPRKVVRKSPDKSAKKPESDKSTKPDTQSKPVTKSEPVTQEEPAKRPEVEKQSKCGTQSKQSKSVTQSEPEAMETEEFVEQVKKYNTRRSAVKSKHVAIEYKSPSKSTEAQREPTVKSSATEEVKSSLASPKAKMTKPPLLNIKTSPLSKDKSKSQVKSPLKTHAKSPLKSQTSSKPAVKSPSKSPSRQTCKTKASPSTSTRPTNSTEETLPPIWLSWKCCLCSYSCSQENLGFLYGPYKSKSDDHWSVGSKRTHPQDNSDDEGSSSDVVELWVHEGCACWAPGVCLVGSELQGLAEAVSNAKDVVCTGCNQQGATIACSNRGCKASFHYPCAIKAKCLLLPDQLLLLCHTHNNQDKAV